MTSDVTKLICVVELLTSPVFKHGPVVVILVIAVFASSRLILRDLFVILNAHIPEVSVVRVGCR